MVADVRPTLHAHIVTLPTFGAGVVVSDALSWLHAHRPGPNETKNLLEADALV
jgi:hypothetical protein